jgi:hypothetical protein
LVYRLGGVSGWVVWCIRRSGSLVKSLGWFSWFTLLRYKEASINPPCNSTSHHRVGSVVRTVYRYYSSYIVASVGWVWCSAPAGNVLRRRSINHAGGRGTSGNHILVVQCQCFHCCRCILVVAVGWCIGRVVGVSDFQVTWGWLTWLVYTTLYGIVDGQSSLLR